MSQVVTCCLLGDESSGKTALLHTYTSKTYPKDHLQAFEPRDVPVTVEDKMYTLVLLDSPADKEMGRTRTVCYGSVDIFVVCFSVIDPQSFANIQKFWLPEIRTYCPSKPFIIVATDIEERYNEETLERLKEKKIEVVTNDQGIAMAQRFGMMYFECSSRNQVGLKELFVQAIQIVKPPIKKSKRCCIQ